jgi:hypothetical protein
LLGIFLLLYRRIKEANGRGMRGRVYTGVFNVTNSRGEPMLALFVETLEFKEVLPAVLQVKKNIETTGGRVSAMNIFTSTINSFI